MAGAAFQGFFPVEVVAVLLSLVAVFLCLHDLRLDECLMTEGGAHLVTRTFVLAHLFGNDVLSTAEGCADVGGRTADHDKTLGGAFGVGFALHQQQLCQWLQSLFACYLCPCSALGLVRQVDILQRRCFPAVVNTFLQFGCHLAQFRDGFHDGRLALGNFLQLFQSIGNGRNLYFVQSARPLLAIARNKRYGASLVQQFQRILHTWFRQVQLVGYQLRKYLDIFHTSSIFFYLPLTSSVLALMFNTSNLQYNANNDTQQTRDEQPVIGRQNADACQYKH